MTAISKSWVTIADSAVDPDSPVDTTLMTGIRDDLVHLREWLGASFTAGAVQDHNHDGVNSALMEVGPNLLRNGSFEEGSAGWTLTPYTGGSVSVGTGNAVHGIKGLEIVSTVLANGGGHATSNEFISIAAGQTLDVRAMLNSSAAGQSAKISVIWYDSGQAQISVTDAYITVATTTTLAEAGGKVVAPASTRYFKVRITGGIPASGTAVGTVYFDGIFCTKQISSVDYQEFSANGTWTKPPGLAGNELVIVEVWGGGGGGSSYGDGGGGGGGGYCRREYLSSELAATETVTIGAGGAVNAPGGTTTFSSGADICRAYGGGQGGPGANYGGGGGGGTLSAGTAGAAGATGGTGGTGYSSSIATPSDTDALSPDSGAGGGGTIHPRAFWGGGGGGVGSAGGGAVSDGGYSAFGGGGGGGGTIGIGGISLHGGDGGAHGAAGVIPAGGGGCLAAGANGLCRVWVIR